MTGSSALKFEMIEDVSDEKKSRTTEDVVKNTYTEELILGICSPIGSNKDIVVNAIKKRLKSYKYEVEIIKLSKFIEKYNTNSFNSQREETKAYTKLMHKIDGGDSLRRNYNNNILLELAIQKIREDRGELETTSVKSRRICYIIDSLKNIDELKLLRSIYRELFYVFSIFSPETERIDKLIEKGLSKPEAERIISTDDFEGILHGQDVRNTFVEADFFVRISETNKQQIEEKIAKYLHLIFESEIVTPHDHEIAMYFAKSAAGNSACLSRQVGASITDNNNVTIATGWNDVPKFKGNLYRDIDKNATRCKDLKYCSNETYKNEIFNEINDEIIKKLNTTIFNDHFNLMQQKENLISDIKDIIENSKFKDVIEYSRSIHAEMHAIIIGSQLTGNKMIGGSLFCTTYPCHNCARHIILAGIKNVYYIEPYKKSLGILLHEDSLTEDENNKDKVRILLYDGVAPRRYLDFFSMNRDSRKMENGKVKIIDIKNVAPKTRLSLQAIPELENQAIHTLKRCGLLDK